MVGELLCELACWTAARSVGQTEFPLASGVVQLPAPSPKPVTVNVLAVPLAPAEGAPSSTTVAATSSPETRRGPDSPLRSPKVEVLYRQVRLRTRPRAGALSPPARARTPAEPPRR